MHKNMRGGEPAVSLLQFLSIASYQFSRFAY